MPLQPSPRFGLRTATQLWPVVIAVWLVASALALPASLVAGRADAQTTGSLPLDDTLIGAGDLELIGRETIGAHPPGVEPLIVLWLVAWWQWTVLWHAGVVHWLIWASSRPLRLGELLGLGIGAWWRYLRLSLSAAAVLGAALALIWLPLALWGVIAVTGSSERLVVPVAAAAVATSIPVLVCCWAATLYGAWLLAMPRRRSALLAWCSGLVHAIRQPLATLGTLAVWGGPLMVAAALPLAAGWFLPSLRGGLDAFLLTQLAALLQAFCSVALFVSFAPASGLVSIETSASVPPKSGSTAARAIPAPAPRATGEPYRRSSTMQRAADSP